MTEAYSNLKLNVLMQTFTQLSTEKGFQQVLHHQIFQKGDISEKHFNQGGKNS